MVELVIIGGGFGFHEIIPLVGAINSASDKKKIEIVGILDDNPRLVGKKIKGIPVLGLISDWHSLPKHILFVFAIGSHQNRLTRKNIIEQNQIPLDRFCSLIHPSSEIMTSASCLGQGLIIHGGVKINPLSVVGDFCLISPNCIIGVANIIGSYTLFAAGVATGTNIMIGSCSFFGTGAILAPDLSIDIGAQIGVGAVVFKDVNRGFKLLGNPAKAYGKDEVDKALQSYGNKDLKELSARLQQETNE